MTGAWLRRRRRRAVAPLPPLRVRLTRKDWDQVLRARASMAAFDAMPEDFRRFCADYGRTARGTALAGLIDEAGGDVAVAQRMLRQLLPVRTE